MRILVGLIIGILIGGGIEATFHPVADLIDHYHISITKT
jgi:hypothetical protein